MGTHTPGPWTVGADAYDMKITMLHVDGESVAFIKKSADSKANARLISAAPELLEALKLFVDASLREVIVSGPHKRTEGEKVYASARAAIRKARGE